MSGGRKAAGERGFCAVDCGHKAGVSQTKLESRRASAFRLLWVSKETLVRDISTGLAVSGS